MVVRFLAVFFVDRLAVFFFVDRLAVFFLAVFFLAAFFLVAFFLVDRLAVFLAAFFLAAFLRFGAAFFLVVRLAVFFLAVRLAAFFFFAILMAPLGKIPYTLVRTDLRGTQRRKVAWISVIAEAEQEDLLFYLFASFYLSCDSACSVSRRFTR